MQKSFLKIIVLILFIGLNWIILSVIGQTLADFSDLETSNGNFFSGGILDFTLHSGESNFVPEEKSENIQPGDEVNRVIQVRNEGFLSFQYTGYTEKISGDDDFCNALQLKAELEGEEKYNGNLMAFSFSPIEISGNNDTWHFKAFLPEDSNFQDKTCRIKFVFNGWQVNLPENSGGFFDQEEIESFFATRGMKINKVYYDVDARHGEEYDNEWVEIYNPLDNPVDISGWEICDNYECDKIPTSNLIPAKGFAVITANANTWEYWEIPPEAIKIVLPDGRIGNGLANDSDRVILKISDEAEVDSMSYGEDNYAFDPPAPDVEEGHILGRSPNGFDTNRASDWRDFGLPVVMVISPNGGETWYVGRTYALQWKATNPNGTDDVLSIDIYYSRDSGESWANIVRGTENDGSYDWRIPVCLDDGEGGCYLIPSSRARIKIVATGPENFMVKDWDMSDGDFCPPIDYNLLTPEELEIVKSLGLMDNSPIEETNPEENIEQNENLEEVVGQSEEEQPSEDSVVEESPTEEQIIEEPTTEESIIEEIPHEELPSDKEVISDKEIVLDEEVAPEEEMSPEENPSIIEGAQIVEEKPITEENESAILPQEQTSSELSSGDSSKNSSGSGGDKENPESNNSSK